MSFSILQCRYGLDSIKDLRMLSSEEVSNKPSWNFAYKSSLVLARLLDRSLSSDIAIG